MEKDCCVVVTHLHQEEMVVDPNNYDVSELREQTTADDPSNDGGDDHGFNWVTDQENSKEDDDSDIEANLPPPENQQYESTNKGQQLDQDNQLSTLKQQQSQEGRQQSSQKNADPDDYGSSKFFTSQDSGSQDDGSQNGGEIRSRQRTDESNTQWTTTADRHERTEASDLITDYDSEEVDGNEKREEWETQKSGERKTQRSERKAQRSGEREAQRREREAQRREREAQRREREAQRSGGRKVEGRKKGRKKESDRQRVERLSVDPINYDLGELRTVTDQTNDGPELDTEAHGFVWSEPPEQHRTRIEDPTSEQYKRLLTIAGIDPELIGEKPYLTRVPTEAAGSFVIDWLEFLTNEAGTKGAIDALTRYQEIGWFTARVENELKNSMSRIDNHDGNGFSVFDQGDHLLSFAYVAKIASINSEGMMFY